MGPLDRPNPASAMELGVMPEYLEARMPSVPVNLMVSALAVFVLLATPADAAKRKHRKHAKAAVPHASAQVVRHRAANQGASGAVYFGDTYLGADPDPFIRSQLLRDLGAQFDGPE